MNTELTDLMFLALATRNYPATRQIVLAPIIASLSDEAKTYIKFTGGEDCIYCGGNSWECEHREI